MFLFIGLGNPGVKYLMNRHNVGFHIIDYLLDSFSESTYKSDCKSLYDLNFCNINNKKVLFLKPLSYMNKSGHVIAPIKSFYKINSSQIFVIYDDIDMDLGKIKLKQGGGNGGHNGIRNINTTIGNSFWKIKVGIGRPPTPGPSVQDYVLQNFKKMEYDLLEKKFLSIRENFTYILEEKHSLFLTRIAENKINE